MINMKKNVTTGITTLLLVAAVARVFAADDIPKASDFARYEGMMNRSPFAVATATATPPPAAPNFAKDLYVANAAHSPEGDLVTIGSSTDKNFKKYLSTRQPVDGYSISNIEWSDRVGATKVTISKDGQFATLTFNQALLSSPVANAPTQMQQQQQQMGDDGSSPVMQAKPFGQTANQPIRPAPIPTLPTPPPRSRAVIQRNPSAPAPVQPVPEDEEE